MLRFQKGERRQAAPTVQNNKLLLCVELRVKVRSSSLPSQHVWRRALWRWLLWCRCRSGRGRNIHSRLQSREDLECVCAGARRATLLRRTRLRRTRLRRTYKSRTLKVGLGRRRWSSSRELCKIRVSGVTNEWGVGATASAHQFRAKLEHSSAQLTPVEHAIVVQVLGGARFSNRLNLSVDQHCEVGNRICRRASGQGSAWHACDTKKGSMPDRGSAHKI